MAQPRNPIAVAILLVSLFISTIFVVLRIPTRKNLSIQRFTTLLVLADAWLFLFSTSVIYVGVGTDGNAAMCSVTSYTCLILYGLTKYVTSLWLLERSYIVMGEGRPRLRSPAYQICSLFLVFWTFLFIAAMAKPEKYKIDSESMECDFSVWLWTPIATICLDIAANTVLAGMFAYKLLSSEFSSPPLKRLAIRSILAAATATVSSVANLVVFCFLHSKETSWLCFVCCTMDSLILSAVIFFITQGETEQSTSPPDSLISPVRLEFHQSCKIDSELGFKDSTREKFQRHDAALSGEDSPFSSLNPIVRG